MMELRLFRDQHRSNFAALLISAAAATVAPLQVFLFVYAFVGPLHYLTEMAWLKKKDFYSGDWLVSSPIYVLIASLLCVAVSVDFYLHRGITAYTVGLLVLLSLSTRIRNPYVLLSLLLAGVLAKFFVHGFVIFIGAILPTIVHVYVFTLLFMISGLVRERKRTLLSWLNPALLLAMPAILLTINPSYRAPGSYWITAETGLSDLHGYLVGLLGSNMHPDASILANPAAAAVLRFLAFIYLFHYLNWFTKTELLKWHRVSRRSWAVILSLYAVSVGCYLWNFLVGFYIVNFLSLLHVFLEFPLDWHTGEFLTSSFTQLWRRPGEQAGKDVSVTVMR